MDGNGNQVLIYATLQAKANSVGSPNDSLSKSDRKDYLYSDKNSNVLTMTPGDIITDDDGNDYEIASVIDAGEIEDSFYIFDIEEIKRRIPNQQEGIYYLTCVKGNVSPFPTGPGVGTNFRGFRFSQPIGQLYPLDYKNDPLWFQIRPDNTRDTTILDTPATICAADNFIHGLVTTNDYKNSETKEVVLDFVENPALNRYEYTTNKIEAQDGNAASGSEDRLVPISGDSGLSYREADYTSNYVVLLLPDLVTTHLSTLVSVLVTTPLVSHSVRKSSWKTSKTSMLRRSVKTAVSSSTRV